MKKTVSLKAIHDEVRASFPWIDDKKFRTLYYGWRCEGLRHKTHSAQFYTACWQRGYMSPATAKELLAYCKK